MSAYAQGSNTKFGLALITLVVIGAVVMAVVSGKPSQNRIVQAGMNQPLSTPGISVVTDRGGGAGQEVGDSGPDSRGMSPEEEAKARAEEAKNRVAGRWVWNTAFKVVELKLNADGMGVIDGCPIASWQANEDGFTSQVEFKGNLNNEEMRLITVTGTVSSDGKQMTVNGYGFYGFGSSQSSPFVRG